MDPLSLQNARRSARQLQQRYGRYLLGGAAVALAVVAVAAIAAVAVGGPGGIGALLRSDFGRSADIDLTEPVTSSTIDSGHAPDDTSSPKPGQRTLIPSGPQLAVHVAGQVRQPGVVLVVQGARVVDAIEAAGGTTKSAAPDAINLAAPVADGQQVYVPSRKELVDETAGGRSSLSTPSGAVSAGGQQPGSTASMVNINTATAQQLESLPGIGPATSAKIIADRTANGPYSSLQDLTRVSGIGEKRVDALQGLAVAR